MTDQQLYFAIGVPVFAVFMGMLTNVVAVMWQSKGLDRSFGERFKSIEGRLDKIERTLEVIQTDLKQFYKDIAQLKARAGLE